MNRRKIIFPGEPRTMKLKRRWGERWERDVEEQRKETFRSMKVAKRLFPNQPGLQKAFINTPIEDRHAFRLEYEPEYRESPLNKFSKYAREAMVSSQSQSLT